MGLIIKKNKLYFFVLFFVLINLVISVCFSLLSNYFSLGGVKKVQDISAYVFFTTVVFAPFVETLIFQFLPIKFFRLFNIKDNLVVMLSGLFFGFLHYFNDFSIIEFLQTSIGGVLLSSAYVMSEKRRFNPFFTTVIIHCLYNLLVLIINLNI